MSAVAAQLQHLTNCPLLPCAVPHLLCNALQAHTCLEERLRAQQEELERHQQEMAARYSELRGWLDRVSRGT